MTIHCASLAASLAILVGGLLAPVAQAEAEAESKAQSQSQSQSQSQAGPTRAELDNIFVIGTRVGDRTALDTPVPVDVLGGNELRASGAVAGEVGQALAVLAPSFNFPRQSNSGSSDLVRAGQLRGMSPDQMLVLVNGRRRHTSAIVNTETKIGRGTAAVDFNNLPMNAIQRVEVLRDGAGALYGSDAIAGVINLVLDDSLGFESNIAYGQHRTDLKPIGDDINDGETFTLDAKYGWQLADDGFFKAGAAWRSRNATNRAGFDQIPFFVDVTDPDRLLLEGKRNYAEGDPEVEELNLWLNGAMPVGELELYVFGTVGDRDSNGGAAFFRYPDESSNVREIYDLGFRPETYGKDRDYAGTIGLRTLAAGWEIDTALSYGRNEFEFGVENSLNASLGPASPTSFKSGTYTVQQTTLGLDTTRDFSVSWLPAPLAVALGVEYRAEDYTMDRGQFQSYQQGTFGNRDGLAGIDDRCNFDDDTDPLDIVLFATLAPRRLPALPPMTRCPSTGAS